MASDKSCTICKNDVGELNVSKTQCKHIFHINCLVKWLKVNNTCPNCRSVIEDEVKNNDIEIENYNRCYLFSYLVDILEFDVDELEGDIVSNIIEDKKEHNNQALLDLFYDADYVESCQAKYIDFVRYVKHPDNSESVYYKVAYKTFISKQHKLHIDGLEPDQKLQNVVEVWRYIESIML